MTRALILAAGKGERLRPLTLKTPKPLLKVADVPILEWQINLLKENNITDITIHTSYLGWKIEQYFGDGAKWEVNIDYIHTKTPIGTAGPIHEFIKRHKPEEPFVMTNGDNFIRLDVEDLVDFHKSKESLATVVLVETKTPEKYGVAICDYDYITAFIEKPENPPSFLVNAGIYVLDPKVVEHLPSRRKKQFQMVEHDLFPVLAEQGQLTWFMPVDVWMPIDTVDAYYAVKQSIEAFRLGRIK